MATKETNVATREPRLYERVAATLRAQLDAGDHAVGARLPSERELAQHFKVSRPTIREAIIALEAEGLVEVRTNSGVYARAVDRAADAGQGIGGAENGVGGFDVLEARRLIEPQIAALAATQIAPATIATLRDLVAAMNAAARAEAMAADREFHLQIAAATGNSAFEPIVQSLWDARTRSVQYSRLEEKAEAAGIVASAAEHARIVDALAAGDAGAARAAMRDHLSRVIDTLLVATEVDAIEQARAQAEERRHRLRRVDGEVRARP